MRILDRYADKSAYASHLLLAACVTQIPLALLLFAWALGLIHLIH
jgi:hypothetical protein